MINLHPHIVHFPVALILTLLVWECWAMFKKHETPPGRRFLLALALLGALGAVATGLFFEKFLPHPHEGIAHEIMERHEIIGYIVLGGMVLLNFLHYKGKRTLFRWLLGAIALLTAYQGYLGGELGHTHGLSLPAGEHPPSHLEQPSHQHRHGH